MITDGEPVKKTELISAILRKTGLSYRDSRRVLDAVLLVLMEFLISGREVPVYPMGKFVFITRKARKRKPQIMQSPTGPREIPGEQRQRRYVKFIGGHILKHLLNHEDNEITIKSTARKKRYASSAARLQVRMESEFFVQSALERQAKAAARAEHEGQRHDPDAAQGGSVPGGGQAGDVDRPDNG